MGEQPLFHRMNSEVITDEADPHKLELNNVGREQWAEIPVRYNDRISAKLVLDHYKLPNGQFTLGEMRLLARLTRLLSVVAQVIEAHKAIRRLSCEGLHVRMLRHFLMRAVGCFQQMSDQTNSAYDGASEELARCINELDAYKDAGKSIRVGDVLQRATRVCDYFRNHVYGVDEIKIREPECNVLITDEDGHFFMVLITLIENACKYAAMRGVTGRTRGIQLEAFKCDSTDGVRVLVSDWGIGVNGDDQRRISDMLNQPFKYLASFHKEHRDGRGGGLAIAAVLAKEMKWTIKLEHANDPTVFELTIPSTIGGP